MAKYRQIHVSFWQDGFVLSLPPEEKYFYLYLMTNSKTTQCGIYELPLKVIEMETGLSSDRIFELIQTFIQYKKIKYNEESREVMLTNWIKHNSMKSPKVAACVEKELASVKHIPYVSDFIRLSKQYGYSINSLSIDSGEEEEQEEEQEEENITTDDFSEVVSAFREIHPNVLDFPMVDSPLLTGMLEDGIPADFIIEVMESKYKPSVKVFSYYKDAIREKFASRPKFKRNTELDHQIELQRRMENYRGEPDQWIFEDTGS